MRSIHVQRVVPFPPSKVFEVVLDVPSYPKFMPYIRSAEWNKKDQRSFPSSFVHDTDECSRPGFRPPASARAQKAKNCDDIDNNNAEHSDPIFRIADICVGYQLWQTCLQHKVSYSPPFGVISLAAPNDMIQHLEYSWDIRPFPHARTPTTKVKLNVKFCLNSMTHVQVWDMVSQPIVDEMIDSFVKRIHEISRQNNANPDKSNNNLSASNPSENRDEPTTACSSTGSRA
jgi:ribosome-associated toxin RatA of RatAB toxin-antitoxin module